MGLINHEAQLGWAYPLFDEHSLCPSGIVVVAEAPNWDDTYNETKRRLTYDIETDPTGNFTRELLQSVNLNVSDVLFTNSVLCLPAHNEGKYKVKSAQKRNCSKWLKALIEFCDAKIVVSLGGQALSALKMISNHEFTLRKDAGKVHIWNNRKLLPLYHPSRLGQVTRSREHQLADIQALKLFI
jgi:uracil-DNA glycosylase family 4